MRLSTTMRRHARRLRRDMTDPESALWAVLRGRKMRGLRFRRQHPLGPFIVDFACLEARLVIEVDGGCHTENPEQDAARDTWLREQAFEVLRFWNHEVQEDLDGVLLRIWLWLGPPSPAAAAAPIPRYAEPSPAARGKDKSGEAKCFPRGSGGKRPPTT